ncbi:MAG: hypothetical protein HY820_12770 [Acidobacteria bacterium]|nr:hypothetical protein [Acidobacteriota bacterium]
MKKLIACLMIWAASAAAQKLTPAQKDADFRYMVSLYATYYAPIDWKNTLFQVDMLNLKPWLDKVARTTTDLDFYEVCAQYIQALNDTHVNYTLPSNFNATLGFGVDLYDGVLLIDTINRTTLPVATYPFGIGDELISIDGESALEVARKLAIYSPQGNPRASLRQGASRITSRAQSRFPHAVDLGESAEVVIQRQNGAVETYTLPWIKTGTPLSVGPVPSPRRATGARSAVVSPDPLEELQWSGITDADLLGVNGYGARNPIYVSALPATFTRRLGGAAADFFYSGVFQRDGLRIGYIRIPNYSPASTAAASAVFQAEVDFFNANTDGLVVDEMRNTGGNLCFGEDLARRLTPYPFQATGFAARPFWNRVRSFYQALVNSKTAGGPIEVIEQYELLYNELLSAAQEGRTLTKPVPICSSSLMRTPYIGNDGNISAYSKPVLVIIDDFSTSTADSFAGMMQDSGRAVLFGMRSNGAGGNNTGFDAGAYSEASVGMTIALQVRPNVRAIEGFPASQYIENAGVRPDIQNDYMTKENLLGNGATFINDFLDAIANHIRQSR